MMEETAVDMVNAFVKFPSLLLSNVFYRFSRSPNDISTMASCK